MNQRSRFATHEVDNQPPPLANHNAFTCDLPLREAMQREHAGWAVDKLQAYGAISGGELVDLGFVANQNKPRLRSHDRFGHRIDEVEFHPAYHQVMALGMSHGVHSLAWNEPRRGAQVARAGMAYLHYQAEAGSSCPLTMTYAAVPALRHCPVLARAWLPKITARDYDPRPLPMTQKRGCTIGMGMTEKQGGSDVRANTTTASADGAAFRIVGHKWFFSAPMSDAWLVLAREPAGISCFLMPRVLPDGTRNAIHIQRLKDKLGDWSNASSEVEFCDAWAERVGDEGRGVATILEMVALTRLDCMTGSAGLMRQALVQALHHCRHRRAFGRLLVDQPLMKNVLADLALEVEAATALAMRTARAVDDAETDLLRVLTAAGKYWVCKRAPGLVNEAQECLGGGGYVEESILPRLFRQAPLNSIWEGSGNVQCLDLLRTLARSRPSRDALVAELSIATGIDADYDRERRRVQSALDDSPAMELCARDVVERIAVTLQAGLLLRFADASIGHAFCAARLGDGRGRLYGTLPAEAPFDLLIQRAWPA